MNTSRASRAPETTGPASRTCAPLDSSERLTFEPPCVVVPDHVMTGEVQDARDGVAHDRGPHGVLRRPDERVGAGKGLTERRGEAVLHPPGKQFLGIGHTSGLSAVST